MQASTLRSHWIPKAKTDVPYSFHWLVHNFQKWGATFASGKCMESEPFQPFVSALGLTDTFTLKLYPRGTREGSDTHVSMVLSWKDIQMFGSEVLFTIHLFGNRTGQCIKSKNTWHTFRADAHELGWMKFIRLDTVEHALRAQEPQGMSIRLEVSFCSPGCHIDMSAALTAPAAPDKRANANMWGDELLSDCIVRARDGSSYRCHRVLLCTASPVFHAMFANAMSESQQQEVTIQAADAAVVLLMLQHVYGLSITVPLPLLMKCMAVAAQYQVEYLHATINCWLKVHAAHPLSFTPETLVNLMTDAIALGMTEAVRALTPAVVGCSTALATLVRQWSFEDIKFVIRTCNDEGTNERSQIGLQMAAAWVQDEPHSRIQHFGELLGLVSDKFGPGCQCVWVASAGH
eukprot:jgi/Chrzof1/5153/Cz15g13150.t1